MGIFYWTNRLENIRKVTWPPSPDVDGEQDDEVGQHLDPSHQPSALEQVLLAGVKTQAVETHGDHCKNQP